MKIQVLDDHTINKIAAGEVIENPSSVVKELVENSIDAGASEISVEIQGGGRVLIRVTDNGEGMGSDDALLCLERHATSKIQKIDDLQFVLTKGFRGEAIPSIASISKFSLMTRLRTAEKGTRIVVEGGRIVETSLDTISAAVFGTTIEVKSLFFNVPVRKKFQRSPAQDIQDVLKGITLLALAHPTVKFSLVSNGKQILKAPSVSGNSFRDRLGERASQVLGKDFFEEMCPLENSENEVRLTGFIGIPSQARHNRSGQYLFINQRAVFCPLVSNVVKEGYGTTLASQRHPIYLLHLEIPGNLVDVNVHPQKREVRLRQSPRIREAILSAVQSTLAARGMNTAFFSDPFEMPFKEDYFFSSPSFLIKESAYVGTEQENFYLDQRPTSKFPLEPVFKQESFSVNSLSSQGLPERVKAIAVVPGYILFSSEGGTLKLVDQRAAHARILFEQLKGRQELSLPSQQFLLPVTFETTPEEASAIREHLDLFEKGGVFIQEFGPKSFSIEAASKLWADVDLIGLIREIAQDLKNFGLEKEKKLVSCAFRLALSSKKKLDLEEAEMLVSQLLKCEVPLYCPVGKQTIAEITSEDLANFFKE